VPSDQPPAAIESDATPTETEPSGDAGEDKDGPEDGGEEEDKKVPGEDAPTADEEDAAPEFPPDELARLNDLLGDPDPDPDRSERGGTSGAFRRAADRVVAATDEAKADAAIRRREPNANEAKPVSNRDLPHKDPHRSQFGNHLFSEMSIEDLKERFAAATGGLQNQARKLDEYDREVMAAQDEEEPVRKKIDELEKALKPKFGVATVKSLFDLVRKGKISVRSVMSIVGVALGEAEIEIKERTELDPRVAKTRAARSKAEAQRDKVLIWLTEQRNIEAELKRREGKKRR